MKSDSEILKRESWGCGKDLKTLQSKSHDSFPSLHPHLLSLSNFSDSNPSQFCALCVHCQNAFANPPTPHKQKELNNQVKMSSCPPPIKWLDSNLRSFRHPCPVPTTPDLTSRIGQIRLWSEKKWFLNGLSPVRSNGSKSQLSLTSQLQRKTAPALCTPGWRLSASGAPTRILSKINRRMQSSKQTAENRSSSGKKLSRLGF